MVALLFAPLLSCAAAAPRDDPPAVPRADSAAPSAGPADRTRVFVCFDGVAYSVMERMWSQGRFRAFHRPSRLVSTFPAITEVMLTELYGVPRPGGYGLRYFDKAENRLIGGILQVRELGVWFRIYDHVTPMALRGLVYFLPASGDLDVRDLKEVVRRRRAAGARLVTLHLDATDAVGHVAGHARVEKLLARLDDAIGELRRESGGALEFVCFSDHGMSDSPCVRIPVERHLERHGYDLVRRLERDSDVVLLPTGLISCGYLYTAEANEQALAETLSSLEGVDFSCYARGETVHIVGRAGHATIERRGGRYRYAAASGDPLALDDVLARARDEGLVDAGGYVEDRALFERTWDHRYPDVVNRVYHGTTGHVRNPGDVMVSLEDGYQCGSAVMSTFLRFKGTHGSLTRKSLTGFVMSTEKELPEVLRTEDLLDEVGWEDLRRGRIDLGTVKSSAW